MKGPFTVLPMVNIASIDLGSHTARLLISRVGESGETFEPLMRKRSYVYLAEDFDPVLKRISTEASARAAMVLKDFSRAMADRQVKRVVAVVAGLLRHLNTSELLVSMSDLLEGALMDFFEGEQHG